MHIHVRKGLFVYVCACVSVHVYVTLNPKPEEDQTPRREFFVVPNIRNSESRLSVNQSSRAMHGVEATGGRSSSSPAAINPTASPPTTANINYSFC